MPLITTTGGGSVRGLGRGRVEAENPFMPQNPISAFVFLGTPSSQSELGNVRNNLMEANADMGFPSSSVLDVYGGGDGSASWTEANGNTYAAGNNSQMASTYQTCNVGNGNGTNFYAVDFCRHLGTLGRGFCLHIFITGEYQSSNVFPPIPSSSKIFESNAYASSNGNPQSVADINQPFCNGISAIVVPSGQYYPLGGLRTLNGSTGFGTGFDGNFMITARNATGGVGRLLALSHHTYVASTSDSWNHPTFSYASLTPEARNTLKHIVQSLYWTAGELSDI